MKKLAVIRGKENPCPYRLKITQACESVGDSVSLMTPVVPEQKPLEHDIQARNNTIYLRHKQNCRCPFADNIIEKAGKVNCSFGDVAAGEKSEHLPPSPLYPQIYVGHGNDVGVYDPRGYYFAPQAVVDVPFGLFSIFANRSNEQQFFKIADKYTNNSTNDIRTKLSSLRDKYYNILATLNGSKPIKKLNEQDLEYLYLEISKWNE